MCFSWTAQFGQSATRSACQRGARSALQDDNPSARPIGHADDQALNHYEPEDSLPCEAKRLQDRVFSNAILHGHHSRRSDQSKDKRDTSVTEALCEADQLN